MKLIGKVTSFADLRTRARTDVRYGKLAMLSAENLGGQVRRGRHVDDVDSSDYAVGVEDAMRWLRINADETDSERGVIEEVNACRDLL